MKKVFMRCVAVALATVLVFSNAVFTAYLGELPQMYIYEPYAEAEIPEILETLYLPELFLYETELQERPAAEATQTVTLGGVQASLATYLYEESYTYVVLSLDEDPGIFGFAYHLDFAPSYWEVASISLAPNSEARGLFMPTLPPMDGGLIPGRLTFAGFFDDWNDPVTTGVVATVRFRAIGESRNMDAFALGDLEIVDEDWNAASLGDGGDSFPSLLDAVRVHRHIAGLVGLDRSSDFYAVADMDDDGFVCVYDFLLLSQKFAGHDVYFGLCEYSLNLFPDDGEPDYAEIVGFSAAQDIVSFSTGFHTTPMVAAGNHHTFVLKNDGTVWGWGANTSGQLGDGSTVNRSTPVQVQNLNNIVTIASWVGHSLALRNDGTLWAWGNNNRGQLGDGTTTRRLTPIRVQNISNVTAIEVVEGRSFALREDGTVWEWGSTMSGPLVNGFVVNPRPVQVQNLSNVIDIAAGGSGTFALRDDGTVWAWGWNNLGQLGDGTRIDRHTPVQVQNLNNIVAILAGANYTIALRSDNTVWAWGWNSAGQLGDGTTTNRLTPVQIPNLRDLTPLAAGVQHSIATKRNGTVWAWGFNSHGQLGDISTISRYTPVLMPNFNNAVAAAAANQHSVALRNDGTVWAWGINSLGELGDGTTSRRLVPVQVRGPGGVGFLNLGQSFPESSLALNGTRVSKTVTRLPGGNYIDVTLSLDENAGILSFMTDLVFDETVLTPVSVEREWDLGEFGLTFPPVEGGRYTNRRIFLAKSTAMSWHTDGLQLSFETGAVATMRFRVNGAVNQALPIALGHLELGICDGNGLTRSISTSTSGEALQQQGANIPVFESLCAFASSATGGIPAFSEIHRECHCHELDCEPCQFERLDELMRSDVFMPFSFDGETSNTPSINFIMPPGVWDYFVIGLDYEPSTECIDIILSYTGIPHERAIISRGAFETNVICYTLFERNATLPPYGTDMPEEPGLRPSILCYTRMERRYCPNGHLYFREFVPFSTEAVCHTLAERNAAYIPCADMMEEHGLNPDTRWDTMLERKYCPNGYVYFQEIAPLSTGMLTVGEMIFIDRIGAVTLGHPLFADFRSFATSAHRGNEIGGWRVYTAIRAGATWTRGRFIGTVKHGYSHLDRHRDITRVELAPGNTIDTHVYGRRITTFWASPQVGQNVISVRGASNRVHHSQILQTNARSVTERHGRGFRNKIAIYPEGGSIGGDSGAALIRMTADRAVLGTHLGRYTTTCGRAVGIYTSVMLYDERTPPEPSILIGDVNGDGRVTSADAIALARWLQSHQIPMLRTPHIDWRAANVFCSSGPPDVDDLVWLARWLVGQLSDHCPNGFFCRFCRY